MRWLFLNILVIAFLGGCSMQVSPTYQSATSLATRKVEETFTPKPISQITLPPSTPNAECLPPCFYGIIPGRTTMTETALFLGASSPASEDFTWKTKAPLRPWYTSYQYLANHIWIQNGLVNSVLIREQQYLTFQMVVDRYGEPEITAIGNPDAFGLEDLFLLYPSKGLAFMGTFRIDQVGFQSDTPTPNIYVDSEIYFQPMRVADLTVEIVATGWRASGSIEGIFPWRGFGHPVR